MQHSKIRRRIKRKTRIRTRIIGTNARPRVAVFRSNKGMFVQFIDDSEQVTLLGVADLGKSDVKTNKVKRALEFGKLLASQAKEKKISAVVFDRSGYAYHGRVKALAEGLREGGLKF